MCSLSLSLSNPYFFAAFFNYPLFSLKSCAFPVSICSTLIANFFLIVFYNTFSSDPLQNPIFLTWNPISRPGNPPHPTPPHPLLVLCFLPSLNRFAFFSCSAGTTRFFGLLSFLQCRILLFYVWMDCIPKKLLNSRLGFSFFYIEFEQNLKVTDCSFNNKILTFFNFFFTSFLEENAAKRIFALLLLLSLCFVLRLMGFLKRNRFWFLVLELNFLCLPYKVKWVFFAIDIFLKVFVL